MFCLPKSMACMGAGLSLMMAGLSFAAEQTTVVQTEQNNPQTVDWRKKLGTFRVGIVGGSRAFLRTKKAQPFRRALEKALGMSVEVFAARDQKALIDAHVGGRIEYAIYSATSYGAAWSMCKCVEPIVVPRSSDGATGFRSIMLAKKSAADDLADLKNKKLIIPGKTSFSGYTLPNYALTNSGAQFDEFGWKLDYQPNSESALNAFLDKKGVAVFGWEPYQFAQSGKKDAGLSFSSRGTLAAISKRHQSAIHTIWRSAPVPHGPHAVRKELAANAKSLLVKFLMGLRQSNPVAYGSIAPFYSGGFVSIDHQPYRMVIDLINHQPSSNRPDQPDQTAAVTAKLVKNIAQSQ